MSNIPHSSLQRHNLIVSILYHLLPGILIGAFYFLLVPTVRAAGYPSVMALNLSALFVLIPIELGILLWKGKQRNGKLSLAGIVRYRKDLPWWQYLIWVPVIFISSGLVITALNPVSGYLQGWFQWIPESMKLGMGLSEEFTREKLIQTYALYFVLIIFLAPTVEELYFRGFLLPRMPERLNWARPLVHSLLFALYHVWSPWMFVARFLALLPLIFVVRWKQNVYLGMIAHWLINSIDFVVGIGFIIQLGKG